MGKTYRKTPQHNTPIYEKINPVDCTPHAAAQTHYRHLDLLLRTGYCLTAA